MSGQTLAQYRATLRAQARQHIRSMAAQAKEELREATKDWSAEKRERYSAERMRQLGELTRLTEDICKLPAPQSYAKTLAWQLEDGELQTIEAASKWLAEFATEYRTASNGGAPWQS